MPKSKTRTRPAPRPVRPAPPVTGEKALEVASLALVQASLEVVREAELHITLTVRAGEGVDQALEVHHYLRSASLGLLVAYSQLAGLPDPRQPTTTPSSADTPK
jgi:hypothetical protein